MLATSLAAYPWLAPLLLAVVLVVGLLVGWALVGRRRAAWALAGAAGAVVLLATLYPTGREIEAGCVLDWRPALLAPEPLANVALFVPVSLLVAVATRSPLLGAIAGAVLSAAIETVQAVLPAIGRSCAVEDWSANVVGAVLGAAVGAAALLLGRRRERTDASDDRERVAS